jgi:preprotein translocase subunit SecA
VQNEDGELVEKQLEEKQQLIEKGLFQSHFPTINLRRLDARWKSHLEF